MRKELVISVMSRKSLVFGVFGTDSGCVTNISYKGFQSTVQRHHHKSKKRKFYHHIRTRS